MNDRIMVMGVLFQGAQNKSLVVFEIVALAIDYISCPGCQNVWISIIMCT